MAGDQRVKPTKLRMEDYADVVPEESEEFVEKLFGHLNPTIEDSADQLNGKLSISKNLNAEEKEITVNIPGVTWRYCDTSGEPALAGTWANFGSPDLDSAFRINSDGLVTIQGTVATGGADEIFTLPAGYRPKGEFNTATAVSTGYARLKITAAGVVSVVGYSATWTAINCSFYADTDGGGQEAVEASDNYTTTGWPKTIKTKIKGPVKHVFVTKTTDTTAGGGNGGNNVKTGGLAAGINWENSGDGQVIIRRIGGLSPGRTYRLRFLLLGE